MGTIADMSDGLYSWWALLTAVTNTLNGEPHYAENT
jgi:hypothetical protein